MDVCRWVNDDSVPGGRFLVPGCWNRAVNGDDADCHCPKPPAHLPPEARALLKALAALRLSEEQIEIALDYLANPMEHIGDGERHEMATD